jgi:hypothetical protein
MSLDQKAQSQKNRTWVLIKTLETFTRSVSREKNFENNLVKMIKIISTLFLLFVVAASAPAAAPSPGPAQAQGPML